MRAPIVATCLFALIAGCRSNTSEPRRITGGQTEATAETAKTAARDGAVRDGATPDGANPDGATRDGANPDGANLDGANPDGANPDGANPDGANQDGASGGSAKPEPGEVHAEVFNVGSGCHRTLCIAGPGELSSRPNLNLGALCRRARGVVKRCEGERCMSAWPVEEWREGLDAMIESFGGSTSSCTVDLAGWSTGAGVVSAELPVALAEDARVGPRQRAVRNLVAMAPLNPGAPAKAKAKARSRAKTLEVAANVSTAFIYRHSQTPKSGDCSSEFEGGPWLSPKPVCSEGTTCFDYDYSKAPLLAYLGRDGARSGLEIGHCDVASLVAKIGLENLARGLEAHSEWVPPYSDGTHGGRQRPEAEPPGERPASSG